MRRLLLATLATAALSGAPALAQYPRYAPPPPVAPYGQVQDPYPDMVAGWYRLYLDREPEPGSVEGWLDKLRAGSTPDLIEAQIAGSQESWTKSGSTPQGFVNRLFQKLANRPATPHEMRFWMAQLNVQSPIDVARGIINRVRPVTNGAYGGYLNTYNYNRY